MLGDGHGWDGVGLEEKAARLRLWSQTEMVVVGSESRFVREMIIYFRAEKLTVPGDSYH